MKTIGIITMHKVINYGSALQAYALQKALEKIGYQSEIIDYIYPNTYHKSLQKVSWLKALLIQIWQMFWENPGKKKERKFNEFYKANLKLSADSYNSQKEIEENPPLYDVYITGSDQVWNPKYIGVDTSFMLSFIHDVRKMSYSASFATSLIPINYQKLYSKYLNEYDAISVREQNGVEVVKELIGKDAKVVLDPTLLLEKKDWTILAGTSLLQIDYPYILVYILGYSFNPYPYVTQFIKYLQDKTHYHVVLLNMSNLKSLSLKNITRVSYAAPQDFVYLFSKASLVVTDSFHGTAFSLNMETPFFSLVKSEKFSDSRVASLLSLADASDRGIKLGQDFPKKSCFEMDFEKIRVQLNTYREDSMAFINTHIGK